MDILRDTLEFLQDLEIMYFSERYYEYKCQYCDFKTDDPRHSDHESDVTCPFGRVISELQAWIRVEESLGDKSPPLEHKDNE